jgi:hypothetical protein
MDGEALRISDCGMRIEQLGVGGQGGFETRPYVKNQLRLSIGFFLARFPMRKFSQVTESEG